MSRLAVVQAHNYLKHSEAFSDADWTKQAGVTVTADQALNPLGTATDADLIDFTAAGGGAGILQQVIVGGVDYRPNTKSVWLKGVLGGEVVTLVDPSVSVGVTTCTLTTSWQRFMLTEASGVQTGNSGLWIRKSSGNQFYAWGAQFARANYAGNYVKTIASAIVAGPIRGIAEPAQNLLKFSEQWDNGAYGMSNMTVTPNAIANPLDGAVTADALVDNATPGVHFAGQAMTAGTEIAGRVYTTSVFAKAGSKSWMLLAADNATVYVNVNLGAGTLGTHTGSQYVSSSIESYGNGWYRCSLTFVSSGSSSNRIYSEPSQDGFVYTGAGDITTYVFGLQQVIGNRPGPYQVTTSAIVDTPAQGAIRSLPSTTRTSIPAVQNLLKHSEQFDNGTDWTPTTSSVTADSIANPVDGLVTADTLVEGGNNGYHFIQGSLVAAFGRTVTLSVFAKAKERGFITIQLSGTSNPALGVDLSDGSNTGLPTGATAYSVVSAGSGWWRISLTRVAVAATTSLTIYTANSKTKNPTYQGDSVSGVYVFGAQGVNANWVGPYVKTVALAVDTGAIRSIA